MPKWLVVARNEYRIHTSRIRRVRPYFPYMVIGLLVVYVVFIAPAFVSLFVDDFLVLLGFFVFFAKFELVLTKIHKFANRWFRSRSNLHQVQLFFRSQLQCLFRRHDPKLISIYVNNSKFSIPDFFIDLQVLYITNKCSPPKLIRQADYSTCPKRHKQIYQHISFIVVLRT